MKVKGILPAATVRGKAGAGGSTIGTVTEFEVQGHDTIITMEIRDGIISGPSLDHYSLGLTCDAVDLPLSVNITRKS